MADDNEVDNEVDNECDKGYDTDHDYDHDHENYYNYEPVVSDEQYLLLKKYILETIKPDAYKLTKIYNPDTETIPQLLTKIIQQNLIKFYQLHPDFTIKPHNDGIIDVAYLHIPEIDTKISEFLSPKISRDEYETINALYPYVKEIDYGSKFIETIKFYTNFIIIIFPLNEEEKQCILKIDRYNDARRGLPILTVDAGGNNMTLDWTHPSHFRDDPTQFSKLVFRKTGILTDIYWSDLHGANYRHYLLPWHIALRPNRFNNCWFLEYNSHLQLPNNTYEVVKFSINCCDS